MTEAEQKQVARAVVETIRRGIQGGSWVYWPPGPMLGQVFDRERCEKDICAALSQFQEPRS